MPSTEASPEPAPTAAPSRPDAGARDEITDYEGGPEGSAGLVQLLKDLADDTRTLVQQEIELLRLEVGRSIKRVAVDGAWIWAGAVVLTVGLICLALAMALGLGVLLGSYWLGALITGAAFLLVGGVLAWRGVRDLRAGGLLPSAPLQSLREDRDWALTEMDELKQGLTEET